MHRWQAAPFPNHTPCTELLQHPGAAVRRPRTAPPHPAWFRTRSLQHFRDTVQKHRFWVHLWHLIRGGGKKGIGIVKNDDGSLDPVIIRVPSRSRTWGDRVTMQSRSTFQSGSVRGNVTVGDNTHSPVKITSVTHEAPTPLWHPQPKSPQTMRQKLCQSGTYLENGAFWCGNVAVDCASHPGREDGPRRGGEPRPLASSTAEERLRGRRRRTESTAASHSSRKS